MSYVDVIKKIREKQEKNRQSNIDGNLPPNLITRKVFEYEDVEKDGYKNVITVEILCTPHKFNPEKRMTLRAIKKILENYGVNGKIGRKILKYILY